MTMMLFIFIRLCCQIKQRLIIPLCSVQSKAKAHGLMDRSFTWLNVSLHTSVAKNDRTRFVPSMAVSVE